MFSNGCINKSLIINDEVTFRRKVISLGQEPFEVKFICKNQAERISIGLSESSKFQLNGSSWYATLYGGELCFYSANSHKQLQLRRAKDKSITRVSSYCTSKDCNLYDIEICGRGGDSPRMAFLICCKNKQGELLADYIAIDDENSFVILNNYDVQIERPSNWYRRL